MKATVRRGSKQRLKTGKEVTRDVRKTATGRDSARRRSTKPATYPITETLRWIADGERLLVKWGAIKSPGAKRVANTVGQLMSVLEALMTLRK